MITNKLAVKGVKWYCDTCLPNFDGAKVSESTANMKRFHNLEQMIANLGGKIELYQKETTQVVLCHLVSCCKVNTYCISIRLDMLTKTKTKPRANN